MATTKTFATDEVLTAADVNTHLAHRVPNPGDPYDTGWVDLIPRGTYQLYSTRPAQIRRTGLNLRIRGAMRTTGMSASASIAVADLPPGFSIDQVEYGVLVRSGGSAPFIPGQWYCQSSGIFYFQTPATLGTYLYFASGSGWDYEQ